jgi:hypothetical protein
MNQTTMLSSPQWFLLLGLAAVVHERLVLYHVDAAEQTPDNCPDEGCAL